MVTGAGDGPQRKMGLRAPPELRILALRIIFDII